MCLCFKSQLKSEINNSSKTERLNVGIKHFDVLASELSGLY